MSENIQNKDIRTKGYVLKRTNYGEFDRILNIITPVGKFSVIAKGVRKEQSKLAGSIEMFTLIDFNIHFGRSDLGLVTGAKILKYHNNIVKDFTKLELAAKILKIASKVSENSDSSEYFNIVNQGLNGINDSERLDLVEAWCLINFEKATGEEINFYSDVSGDKLNVNDVYNWNSIEKAFEKNVNGEYGSNEIKLLRLMVSSDLSVIKRVKIQDDMMALILRLVREVV